MDARYTMDSVGNAPYNHILTSPEASVPPHQALTPYSDRDTGRQDLLGTAAKAPYAPSPGFNISSGQGYFTVESLEGGVTAPRDMIRGRSDGEGRLGLGHQGFENNMFGSGLQNGLGHQMPSPFGVPAPTNYPPPRMSQEMDLRRGAVDSGERSYPLPEQPGLLPGVAAQARPSLFPGGAAYERPPLLPHPSVGPGFGGPPPHSGGPGIWRPPPHRPVGPGSAGPQEMELKHGNELGTATLEPRRDIEHGARIWEARIREAEIREAQIREMQFREAQIRQARLRDARLSLMQERTLERYGKPPFTRRQLGLSSGSRRTRQGGNKTWCSVCKLECDTSFNLKGHLGGKRHKMKLAETAKKSSEKMAVEMDNPNMEGASKDDESEAQKDEADKADKIPTVDTVTKVKLEHLSNDPEEQVLTVIASVPSSSSKRSAAEDNNAAESATKKLKQESNAAGASEVADKKGTGRKILRCETCNVICFSKFDLDVHLGGKRHAFHLKQLQQGGVSQFLKANEAGLESKEVDQAAESVDDIKGGSNNVLDLSSLCALAERTGRIKG